MAARKLSKCLDPNYNNSPPTDVKFLFKEECGSIKEVAAHRVILAIASDVFNREFFGSMEAEDEIEINDATQEVFKTMIEYIYDKQKDWKGHDLIHLCSLYYLAEKYNIEDLRGEIIASIPEQKVSKENALDIAILAENNIHHRPLSDALYDASASFLKIKFKDVDSVVDFFSEQENHEEHALVIFKIIKKIRRIKCGNCQQTPCLNGKGVTHQNFEPGANVTARQGEGEYSGIKKLGRKVGSLCIVGCWEDGTEVSGCGLNLVNPHYYTYNCV